MPAVNSPGGYEDQVHASGVTRITRSWGCLGEVVADAFSR